MIKSFCITFVGVSFFAGGIFMISGCDADRVNSKEPKPSVVKKEVEFKELPSPLLGNAHRLNKYIVVGAVPLGAAAFKQLRDWNIKTVISVDGAIPDVKNASKVGLKYIHLPLGYDTIPQARSEQLAKAILEAKESKSGVYIHCHLGKHRSPSATAAACVLLGDLQPSDAIRLLEKMGTSKEYLGLWKSVSEAKKVDRQKLIDLKYLFSEIETTPALTGMLQLGESSENLKVCRSAQWKTPKTHPDLDPAHEALKIREVFAEMLRHENEKNLSNWDDKKDDKQNVAEIKVKAKHVYTQRAHDAAKALETVLRKDDISDEDSQYKLEVLYYNLKQSCSDCHRDFRNNK